MALTDDAEAILGRPVIGAALGLLIGDLNERLRVREMELVHETAPAEGVTLPDGFREALEVKVDETVLAPVPLSQLQEGFFAIVGNELRLKDAGDVLTLTYRAGMTSDEDDIGAKIAAAFPSLMLYGLLTHHATLARDDDGIARWSPRFEAALANANQTDVRARQSEISMRPAPRYCA